MTNAMRSLTAEVESARTGLDTAANNMVKTTANNLISILKTFI